MVWDSEKELAELYVKEKIIQEAKSGGELQVEIWEGQVYEILWR